MGLLGWLRERGLSWLGSWRSDTPARRELEGEKIKTRLGGVAGKVWWWPYYDMATGETPGHRAAYRKMLADPTVKAAVFSKLFGVASLDHQVHPADDAPRGRLAADFIDHVIRRVKNQVRGLAESILLGGLIDGYSVAEKTWEVEPRGRWAGKLVLKALKWKDPDTLILIGDEFKNITSVVGRQYNAGQEFDRSHFVIWQHMPLYESPTGMSDLRAAYRAWWLIDTAWKLRAIHLEKYSSPMLKGTYTESGEQKRQLEEALENAKTSTWLSIPAGALVEAFELSQKGTSDFRDAILDLRHEIMLGITGAILQALEGAKTGARSIGEVHQTTADLLVWYLSDCLGDVFSQQVIPDAIDLNFAGVDYPHITLGGVDEQQLQSALAIDRGLQEMGLPLSRKELYDRYRRGQPRDSEDVLEPPALPLTLPGDRGGPGGAAGSFFRGAETSWGYRLQESGVRNRGSG